MSRTKLIESLRYCKEHDQCDDDASASCPYKHHWTDGEDCQYWLLADAAAALEADDERIAELERILKAVQENSGINFRMWQEAEARMRTVTDCHTLEEGERCR